MKRIILIVFCICLFVSCKNENKPLDENAEVAEKKVIDTLFTITLNTTIKKDDSFQIYYRTASQPTYIETNSFFTEFKGSDKPQDIVFRMPDGIIPDYIRLDFGTNKDQDPIIINNFKMSYFGKVFETKGSGIFNYLLVAQKTATVDKDKSVLLPLTVDGIHDPQATSEKALYDEIQKIIK